VTHLLEKPKVGYWSTHKLHKMNVKDLVEEFCGWTALKELMATIFDERLRAFLAALFLTGGRVSEVLSLTRGNFEVRKTDGVILARNMKLLKRYKKLSEITKEDGSKRWETERLDKTRKTFPILLNEPFVPILIEWREKRKGLLFPSPSRRDEDKNALPLTRFWAYNNIRKIDSHLPQELRISLGLNRPLMASEEGKSVKVKDQLNLWLHWFRSQRASQLVSDYGYEVIDLVDYFSWESYDTALRYARQGWRGLASKMQKSKVNF
jgi:hypothetical protein